jgi:hypothetical protein
LSETGEHSGRDATFAGAGAGTGFIGLVSQLPESLHWLRDLLVFAAPSLTVAFAVAWVFISAYAMKRIRHYQLSGAITEAEKICDSICNDPKSSRTDKSNAKQSVADLKRLQMDALQEHVSDVQARLKKMAS